MDEMNDRSEEVEDMFKWVEDNFLSAKKRFDEMNVIHGGTISFANPTREGGALLGVEKNNKRFFVMVHDIRIEEVVADIDEEWI